MSGMWLKIACVSIIVVGTLANDDFNWAMPGKNMIQQTCDTGTCPSATKNLKIESDDNTNFFDPHDIAVFTVLGPPTTSQICFVGCVGGTGQFTVHALPNNASFIHSITDLQITRAFAPSAFQYLVPVTKGSCQVSAYSALCVQSRIASFIITCQGQDNCDLDVSLGVYYGLNGNIDYNDPPVHVFGSDSFGSSLEVGNSSVDITESDREADHKWMLVVAGVGGGMIGTIIIGTIVVIVKRHRQEIRERVVPRRLVDFLNPTTAQS